MLIKELRSGSNRWIEYRRYDEEGRRIERANPSAVTGYDDSQADLGVALRSDDGLIQVRDYYTSSGGGAAKGRLRFRKIKRGSTGQEIKRAAFEYATHSAGGVTVHPLSKQTEFRNDDGTGAIQTAYQYLWHPDTVQMLQRTTVLPPVPADQNGSGTADTRLERFDQYGYPTWTQDARGFLTRSEHNVATGALVQRIDDVDTSLVSDAPSGWTTAPGGGLHLVNDFEHDQLGRPAEQLGPRHTIDIGGTPAEVRRATWYINDDMAHEVRTAQGYATGAGPNYTYTLINPVTITRRDRNGNVLEQIQAVRSNTSGKLQPSDDFPQSSYVRWTTYQYIHCCLLASTRVYHTIPASGEGGQSANYDQTDFGYDSSKRRNRSVSPGGTIRFDVLDTRNQVVSTYIGTDDSGATESDPFMQPHILQQIQGSQQIGFIENKILNTWRHLLASLNLLETRVPAVPASQKGGENGGHARRAVRRLRQRGVGTGRPETVLSLPMIAVLARAVLFTDPLTTPKMHESAKHSRKSKPVAAVKTYQGVVDNGIIRLDPEIRLPENLQVFVVVPEIVDERPLQIHSPRLVHRNQLPGFAKEVS